MKKRFPAFFLALALCIGLALPAHAANTTPVTAAGISFNAMVTDRYESLKSQSEGYSWADSYGPEAEFLYSIGWQAVREEGVDDGFYGIADFHAYLVEDNATLDFHLKKGEQFSIEGYYLSVIGTNSETKVYDLIYIQGATFTAPEDGFLVDKTFIDQNYPGANFLFCYLGSYTDFDSSKGVSIVFADENATPRTIPTFTDVPGWCTKPVNWAAANEITQGTGNGKFSPGRDCTHAQILTFLWRAENKPDSTATAFSHLAGDYAPAANWAYEEGLIDDSFDPNAPCTRAQAVSYIWQAFNKQDAAASSFPDVDDGAGYAKAVDWAVENGIAEGYEDGTFGPDKVCSRGVIVTLLQRAYVPSTRLTVGK